MSGAITFEELLRRVRAGDNDALVILQERYGDEVRRMARVRIRSAQLRRVLDSADVWQSVLFSFARRAARGDWQDDLNSSEDLLKLLATMTRYKVIDQQRKAHAVTRGGGDEHGIVDPDIPAPDPSPSGEVANKELLALALEQVSAEERQVLELFYFQGLPWEEIARRLGGTPDGRRVQRDRIFKRLRDKFGDEGDGRGQP
jgi:RNA polymerase sigma factor (sigma-70 family)